MRDTLTRLLATCLALAAMALPAAAQIRDAANPRQPIIGDFAGEIRRADGHIDTPATLAALKELRANTYFYLIWHAATDWEDLPAFARAAEREGIDVWVYLIPWSETPLQKKSWGFSEPYRVDYVRWAKEVAQLSLDHRNIVGYVIDDFYTNTQPDRFSVAYTRRMIDAGRAINPDLKFYPLVYFGQPWTEFMDRFGDMVDGVVAAYPKSRTQVGNALVHLNRQPHGASVNIDLPRTATRAGDKGTIWADLKVTRPEDATISFYWDDADLKHNRGYHQVFVRVDNRIVWQSDTSGDNSDRVVEVNLARAVRGRDHVRVELGVLEQKAVTRYPVSVRIDDIRLTGFDTGTGTEMASDKLFSRKATGPFTVNLLPASAGGEGRALPMILMPTGEGEQYEKRYPEPGTPRNVARRVAQSLDLALAGRVEGVVTYCLPKGQNDPTFRAVAPEFRRAASQPTGATTASDRREASRP